MNFFKILMSFLMIKFNFGYMIPNKFLYLDYMCGTGVSTIKLKNLTQKCIDNIAIVGIDTNQKKINIARDRLYKNKNDKNDNDNIAFVNGDLSELGIQDDVFDLVQIKDLDKMNYKLLKNIYKILKPNGTLLVVNNDKIPKFYLKKIEKLFKECQECWIYGELQYQIFFKN